MENDKNDRSGHDKNDHDREPRPQPRPVHSPRPHGS
jgi:hypothetical protein